MLKIFYRLLIFSNFWWKYISICYQQNEIVSPRSQLEIYKYTTGPSTIQEIDINFATSLNCVLVLFQFSRAGQVHNLITRIQIVLMGLLSFQIVFTFTFFFTFQHICSIVFRCFSCASADYEILFDRFKNLKESLSYPHFGDICDDAEKLIAMAPIEICSTTCVSILEPQYFGGDVFIFF